MSNPDLDYYCPYCGAKNVGIQQYCVQCGSLIQEPKQISPSSPPSPSTLPKKSFTPHEIISSPLFDVIQSYLLVNWSFAELKDAMIYNKTGQESGRITRRLSDFGIDYSVIDSSTQESVTIQQYDPTHFRLVTREGKELAVIESRKVKETLEVRHSGSGSVAYFTELEEFTRKKTIYWQDEEHGIAEIHRTRVEELPGDLKTTNCYTLIVKKADVKLRLVLGLAILCLIMFKSNPYH